MTPDKRNAPAGNWGESENLAGGPSAQILLPVRDDFPECIPLRPETDARLERLAEGLILDVVSPRQFVGGLAAFYWASHELQAWAEVNRLAARVARLERDCDRLHFLAFNRGKTGADYMRAQTDELWRLGVAA